MTTYDFIIIGAGLMGSAAGKYLAQSGAKVLIIGQDEPANYQTHDAVFASHYDEGRLTNILSRDVTWARLSAESIAQYPIIEAQSGITFHGPVGGLVVAHHMETYKFGLHAEEIIQEYHLPMTRYASSEAINKAHPMFVFPAGFTGLLEGAPAGWINPRKLVAAQLKIAQQAGATLVRDVVVAAQKTGNVVEVTTKRGDICQGAKVIVATGSFTNTYDVLTKKLPVTVKTETVILAEISEAEAAKLGGMPILSYEIQSDKIAGIYMTPPMRYPDGKMYIKMGNDTATDEWPKDLPAMQKWMKYGRDDGMGPVMFDALRGFMPGVAFSGLRTVPCLVTYTPHKKPFIDELDKGVFILTAGNGTSAKCSDTLGLLGAQLAMGQGWPAPFNRAEFAVVE